MKVEKDLAPSFRTKLRAHLRNPYSCDMPYLRYDQIRRFLFKQGMRSWFDLRHFLGNYQIPLSLITLD